MQSYSDCYEAERIDYFGQMLPPDQCWSILEMPPYCVEASDIINDNMWVELHVEVLHDSCAKLFAYSIKETVAELPESWLGLARTKFPTPTFADLISTVLGPEEMQTVSWKLTLSSRSPFTTAVRKICGGSESIVTSAPSWSAMRDVSRSASQRQMVKSTGNQLPITTSRKILGWRAKLWSISWTKTGPTSITWVRFLHSHWCGFSEPFSASKSQFGPHSKIKSAWLRRALT